MFKIIELSMNFTGGWLTVASIETAYRIPVLIMDRTQMTSEI